MTNDPSSDDTTPSGLPPFLETLSRGPVVFDGATGTLLYERGVYLNKCFDELSLSQPDLVESVHRDYVDVGVDVIQTNTYATNRIALAHHGLEDRVPDIVDAAVQVAKRASQGRVYVAGSMGPSGLLPKDLIRNRTRRQAFEAFHEVALALAKAGVDLLVFETFGYLGELEIAVEAAYGVKVPLVAQASFDDRLLTQDGATPEEVVQRLADLGVDVVGANCVLGPERLLEVVERMIAAQSVAPAQKIPITMQPNAGYPRSVDGRAIFQSSPETFGVVARRAFKLGVAAVGGCCGTGPDHMRRVVASARMLGGGRWRPSTPQVQVRDNADRPRGSEPLPLPARSALGAKIARGDFVVSVEVLPPVGLDPRNVLDKIRSLEGKGVDAVNIPDGPRATVRMSNFALAKRVVDETPIEPLLHVCARDRNLLALQGDLLGAHTLGIHNLVIITGDPPKVGDYPDATAVFDLDSIGLLSMASGLNQGLDPAGKAIGDRTHFVLATGAEPAALDLDREIRRLREKRDAGAEFVMTQPVYDPQILSRFLDATEDLGLPMLVGILPLASSKNAEFLHRHVPGMRIPESVRKRMAAQTEGKAARDEGVKIAAETLLAVKDRVQGVYLMPPFGRVELALEVLEKAG